MKKLALTLVATLACGVVMAQELQVGAHNVTKESGTDNIDTIADNALFTNLRSTPLINFATTGRDILGPSNSLSLPQHWGAIPFVPSISARAKTLKAAIQWVSGTKRVRLGIYNDAQGVPGTLLPGGQGATTLIPTYPSCCDLAVVTLAGRGPLLAAGTEYWLVATTDNQQAPDFTGKWLDANIASNADKIGAAVWNPTDFPWSAGEVDGTADDSCPSPCPSGSGGTCVCNGSSCACESASSLEELFSLAAGNESTAFYPTREFTIEKIREIFAPPLFETRLRDDGAIEIIKRDLR